MKRRKEKREERNREEREREMWVVTGSLGAGIRMGSNAAAVFVSPTRRTEKTVKWPFREYQACMGEYQACMGGYVERMALGGRGRRGRRSGKKKKEYVERVGGVAAWPYREHVVSPLQCLDLRGSDPGDPDKIADKVVERGERRLELWEVDGT